MGTIGASYLRIKGSDISVIFFYDFLVQDFLACLIKCIRDFSVPIAKHLTYSDGPLETLL